MTRLRGWFMRGTALVAKVPHGHWKTLTFIGGLRQGEIVAPCVFDGPINAATFTAWVEQSLVPTLKPGDVVVLDNLSSHKDPRARRASGRSAPTSSSCRPTALRCPPHQASLGVAPGQLRPTSTPSKWSSPS